MHMAFLCSIVNHTTSRTLLLNQIRKKHIKKLIGKKCNPMNSECNKSYMFSILKWRSLHNYLVALEKGPNSTVTLKRNNILVRVNGRSSNL